MGQIVFVVWREAVEALLVVGVLSAWLSHGATEGNARTGRLALWAGVLAGLALATGLGLVLLFFSDLFGDEGEDYFQAVMALVAGGLILQMVAWSRRRRRSWTTQLQGDMAIAVQRSNWAGIFLLPALAVAREGSETAVFLYGNFTAVAGDEILIALAAATLGLFAALMTYGLVQFGSKVLSWRLFFRVTEVMLMLLAAALVMTGIDRLVGLGVIPQLTPPLWSTSWILDDGSPFGGLVSSLTGYRARPDLTQLIAYAGFWGIAWFVARGRRPTIVRQSV